MALEVYTSVEDTTTQLNDGLPFRFEGITGLGGAPVVRHQQRGPTQSGVTDLGYRIQPRTIEVRLVFTASDDATLDGYRDTLMAAFAPLDAITTFLSVKRDDDEIRTLKCHRVGEVEITLAPELRPSHTHRARVTLRSAASPLWQANTITQGSVTFTELSDWSTLGGATGAGQVRGIATYPPTSGTIYTFPGGALSGDWAVAVVTAKDTSGTTSHYAWSDDGSVSFGRFSTDTTKYFMYDADAGTVWPGSTDYNLHVIASVGGTQQWRYWDGSALTTYRSHPVDATLDNTGVWRNDAVGDGSTAWGPDIRKGLILGTPTQAQLNLLPYYMLDTLPGSVTLVNDGDVPAYPLITLQGPIQDPVIVNQTTGGTIDLTGGTISSGQTWTIDLRTGNKKIYDNAGVNQLGSVTTLPIVLADFALPPAPIASGGTNVLVMTAGSVGAAAVFGAQIQAQYLSF